MGNLELPSHLSKFILVLFVFFIFLVLTNLLNGLAIADIAELRNESVANSQISMAEQIYKYERINIFIHGNKFTRVLFKLVYCAFFSFFAFVSLIFLKCFESRRNSKMRAQLRDDDPSSTIWPWEFITEPLYISDWLKETTFRKSGYKPWTMVNLGYRLGPQSMLDEGRIILDNKDKENNEMEIDEEFQYKLKRKQDTMDCMRDKVANVEDSQKSAQKELETMRGKLEDMYSKLDVMQNKLESMQDNLHMRQNHLALETMNDKLESILEAIKNK